MGIFKKRTFSVAVCQDKNPGVDSIRKEYTILKNSKFGWVADPFPFEKNGKLYIFAELFDYRKGKGVIAYTEQKNSGFSDWKIIIEEKYHLSFPNIKNICDELYMIPETSEAESICAYKCIHFPDRWEKICNLATGEKYCDTVFMNEIGFSYVAKGSADYNDGHLKMFRVEDRKCVFLDVEPQLVYKDAKRPGGNPFFDKKLKRWIGVFQLGNPIYGAGIVLKSLLVNWPEYAEGLIKVIKPVDIKIDKTRKYDGIHTFNISQNFAVIDLAYMSFNPIEFYYRIKRKLFKQGIIWKN